MKGQNETCQRVEFRISLAADRASRSNRDQISIMKTKNLLALSTSVAAGVSASADIQYMKLSESLTTNVYEEGLRFNLREGTASKDPISTDEVSEFRLSFDLSSSAKPMIQSLGEEDGVFVFGSQTVAAKLAENDLISDSGNYRNNEH